MNENNLGQGWTSHGRRYEWTRRGSSSPAAQSWWWLRRMSSPITCPRPPDFVHSPQFSASSDSPRSEASLLRSALGVFLHPSRAFSSVLAPPLALLQCKPEVQESYQPHSPGESGDFCRDALSPVPRAGQFWETILVSCGCYKKLPQTG